MVRVEYRCGDGTPFPVEFADERDAGITWALDLEHSPRRYTPMAEALSRLGDAGACAGYHEAGMLRPAFFRPGPAANGFAYWSHEEMSPDDLTVLFTGGTALVERYGSAMAIWRELSLPIVQADCAALDQTGADTPLATLAELHGHAMSLTMVPAFVGGHDLDQLAAAVAALHGDAAKLVAHELTQGVGNPTLEADRRLWQLARRAAASAPVRDALAGDDPAAALAELREAGREGDFFAALDGFLAEFGLRAEGWDIADATWAEQGTGFWAQVRHLAGPDVPDPAQAVERAAVRRARHIADIEAALGDDDDALARFRRRLDRLAPYVAMREERAHWQLVGTGALRTAVLRRGAAMAAAGALDQADDVLFLRPEEVDGGEQAAALRSLVAERRVEHARWLRTPPPPTIGGEGAAPPTEQAVTVTAVPVTAATGAAATGAPTATGATAVENVDSGVLIRGVGGSRGTVTGTARVVTDLADADRLEPGDVLVCVMTSPAWTALFGLASAVVADSGDLGSHVAIAAREYGIPCVLGTKTGTTAIADGTTVTVDGDAGLVCRPGGA